MEAPQSMLILVWMIALVPPITKANANSIIIHSTYYEDQFKINSKPCPSFGTMSRRVRCYGEMFKMLPNFSKEVEEITIINSRLQFLASNDLAAYSSLHLLNLAGNRLESLHNNTFVNNGQLKILILSFSLISLIDSFTFYNLTNLEELDLRFGRLQALSNGTFRFQSKLQRLWLDGNRLHIIDDDAFIDLYQLELLSLSHNQIERIDDPFFVDLKHLQHLYLGHNMLEFIGNDTFEDLHNVQELDLSYNRINFIYPNAFPKNGTLRYLDLSHNPLRIDGIQRDAFKELIGLQIELQSDDPILCANITKRIGLRCRSIGDGISNQKHLIASNYLCLILFIVIIVNLLGNRLPFIAFLQQFYGKKATSEDVFIHSLTLSSWLMFAYCLILLTANFLLTDQYAHNAAIWRKSDLCQAAGVMATTGFEVSIMLMALAMSDAEMHINRLPRRTYSNITLAMVTFYCWAIALSFSILPFYLDNYSKIDNYTVGRFYGSEDGACLGLHLRPRKLYKTFDESVWTKSNYLSGIVLGPYNLFFLWIAFIRLRWVLNNDINKFDKLQMIAWSRIKSLLLLFTNLWITWSVMAVAKVCFYVGIELDNRFVALISLGVIPFNSVLIVIGRHLQTMEDILNRFKLQSLNLFERESKIKLSTYKKLIEGAFWSAKTSAEIKSNQKHQLEMFTESKMIDTKMEVMDSNHSNKLKELSIDRETDSCYYTI